MENEMSNGTVEKEKAIKRVTDAADLDWINAARKAFWKVAKSEHRFNSDHVWNLLDKRGVARPPESRAMVAVVRWALAEGLIRPLGKGDMAVSTRPERHRGWVQMYTSLIA
jgi:hypothetical protein